MILSIDPGINGCGCAVFDDQREGFLGLLTYAVYVQNRERREKGSTEAHRAAEAAQSVVCWLDRACVSTLVVEWPQVYREAKLKGDPNDLLPLAGIDAALCALLPSARCVSLRPREWKGTVDPDAMAQRVLSRLAPDETRAIKETRPSLIHNVLDAIGIGLFFVGRLEARRVIHR